MTSLFLVLLSLIRPAEAWDGFFKYGIGLADRDVTTSIKTAAVGARLPLGSIFVLQAEGGFWTDRDPNRKGSPYLALAPGIEVEPMNFPFYLAASWGPAYVFSPDNVLLSGRFQFQHNLTLGVKDEKDRMIGITSEHFSNAGILEPNIGRDFVIVNLQWPM